MPSRRGFTPNQKANSNSRTPPPRRAQLPGARSQLLCHFRRGGTDPEPPDGRAHVFFRFSDSPFTLRYWGDTFSNHGAHYSQGPGLQHQRADRGLGGLPSSRPSPTLTPRTTRRGSPPAALTRADSRRDPPPSPLLAGCAHGGPAPGSSPARHRKYREELGFAPRCASGRVWVTRGGF